MRVKIKITPDDILQIREDLAHAAVSVKNGGKEVLQPYTQEVLEKIVKKARKKSREMDMKSSGFEEVYGLSIEGSEKIQGE